VPPCERPNAERKFILAASAALHHNGDMSEDHQFTVRVEPDSSRPGRFRWALFKAQQAYNRSEMSYATKREAADEAAKVLDRRITAWRTPR
jgi:hypothetical protein